MDAPDGFRAIETIQPGEVIFSRDESNPSGRVEAKDVEEVFERFGPVLHLHVGGQVIRTTAEHPFFAYVKGWIAAQDLLPDDYLLSETGEWKRVEEIFDTGEWEPVYNLRVADWHTYFVGDTDWGWACWSHNTYDFLSGLKVLELTEAKGAVISESIRSNILKKIHSEGNYGAVGDPSALAGRIADAVKRASSAGVAVTAYLNLVGVKKALAKKENEVAIAQGTGSTKTPDKNTISGWTAYIHKTFGVDSIDGTFDVYIQNHHPAGANNPHGHNIIFKDAAAGGSGKAEAQGARDILLYTGINPYFSRENLVYAPNQGHTANAIKTMYGELKDMFESGSRSKMQISSKLRNFAKRFVSGNL